MQISKADRQKLYDDRAKRVAALRELRAATDTAREAEIQDKITEMEGGS